MMKETTLEVGGLVAKMEFLAVEKRSSAMEGVIDVAMNAAASTATVTYDETRADAEVIRREIEAGSFHCGGGACASRLRSGQHCCAAAASRERRRQRPRAAREEA